MKKILFLILLSFSVGLVAQEATPKYKIMITGASFVTPSNGWFELGCKFLDAEPNNKAVSGSAIVDAANVQSKGELYSVKELDDTDMLVIMHVHNKDVAANGALKISCEDYTLPFDRKSYAAAYDYFIKRYYTDCYNLKDNKESKYYGTSYGKPVVIVMTTHWNDSRTVFNLAIRKLAAKWGFPLIEFDTNIGFSANVNHPVTGVQTSTQFARNNQKIDDVEHGWHAIEGEEEFVQQRMASIFVDAMQKLLPLR